MTDTPASLSSLICLVPMDAGHWLLLLLAALVSVGIWHFQKQKIIALNKQRTDESSAHESALQTFKNEAAAQDELARQKLAEAALAHQVLEQRHQTLREAAQLREQESEQSIELLKAELSAIQAVAAQLEPAKVRIGDLETALNAERGRASALEQAIEITQKRADEVERRLEQAHQEHARDRQQNEQRECERAVEISKLEENIKANANLVATAESQITQANETLASYKQQAETRITNLQRQLAAAEAKSVLVQKEFMSAVGVLPEKPVTHSRSMAVADDKRVAELEAKIVQLEAESRKKAREDGYKIAELEYRLNEALEKNS